MRARWVMLLAGCVFATAAHATFWTGNDLLKHLRGDELDRLLAMGYIAGVHDMGNSVTHCTPERVSLGQLREMVTKFLETYPQIRNQPGDALVVAVLQAAWPCAAPPAQKGKGAGRGALY